jgi:hypothetical protein
MKFGAGAPCSAAADLSHQFRENRSCSSIERRLAAHRVLACTPCASRCCRQSWRCFDRLVGLLIDGVVRSFGLDTWSGHLATRDGGHP